MDHENKQRNDHQHELSSQGCHGSSNSDHRHSQHNGHGGHSCCGGMGSPWFLIIIGAGFLLFYFLGR